MFSANRGMALTSLSTDGASSRPISPFSFGSIQQLLAPDFKEETVNKAQTALEPQTIFGSGSSGYASVGTPPLISDNELFQQVSLALRIQTQGYGNLQSQMNESFRTQLQHKMAKPDSFKTVMCKGWLETGGCSFGENCRFAHGEEELRPTRLPVDNPKYKTKLCDKYTKTGVCPYGDRCLFIHPKSLSAGEVSSNPYIHPARMAQLCGEQSRISVNAATKQNPDGTPLSSRTNARISSWSLSTLRHVKKDNKDLKLSDSWAPSRTPSPSDIGIAVHELEQVRSFSSLSNFAPKTFNSTEPLIEFPDENEETGDSDTAAEEKENHIWSERISQVFDFILQSDNMARSLAMSEPFLN